jgi:poly(ADP-ribose) glycohydrolase ARH3
MTQTNLVSRFLGSMVGSALGDAIGEMAFHARSAEALRAHINAQDYLKYTDDTAMAIGLAESLTAIGRLDEQHLGDTFRANYDREPWRGYGMGPPTIFYRVKHEGISYRQAAGEIFKGQGSFGNGAAMRVAPLGLFFHADAELYALVEKASLVTHTHPIAIDGAAVVALAIAEAMQLGTQSDFPREAFVRSLIDACRTDEMCEKMCLVQELLAQDIADYQVGRTLKMSVATHESVPFALFAFLKYPKSYVDCLYCASLNGGDRDTMAAMAGGVAGAYLGIEAMPQEWRHKLENRAYIEELACKLAEIARKEENDAHRHHQ